MDSMVKVIADALTGICPPYVIVAIISMIPLLELRGGILVALPILHTSLLPTYVTAVVANMIPIPFIMLFIGKIFDFLRKFKISGKIVNNLEEKTLSKREQIDKYGLWGLYLFVAIPLPGTGAWTGALLSVLLGIKPKKAFPAIFAGVATAGIIMTILGYGLGTFTA